MCVNSVYYNTVHVWRRCYMIYLCTNVSIHSVTLYCITTLFTWRRWENGSMSYDKFVLFETTEVGGWGGGWCGVGWSLTFLMCSMYSALSPVKRLSLGPGRILDAATRSVFRDDRQRAKTASPVVCPRSYTNTRTGTHTSP